MSRIGKIARRTFLVGSAAIVGGVAFGVWQVRRPAPNPLKPGAGEVALNPFVLINADGITLIAPRAEMGQGVHTTWAALIAEELDVDLHDIRIEHGPPAAAYYNTAYGPDALPVRGYDTSDFIQNVGQALGHAGKLLKLQVTGGSSSMKDGFERMRRTGASARETLKEAAAQRLGISRDALTTRAGRVITPDGAELPYADLAEAAAALDPIDAPLRDPADWTILGRAQKRPDMPAKSTGTAQFGIDVRLPGMKFATVRMNPGRGAAMRGFDAAAAESMAGVQRVVDLGDGIAVIASNTWLALQAAEAVEIEWEPAPYPTETEQVFSKISEAFDGRANSTLRNDGEPDAVPEGATEVSAEYRVPYLAHTTMEPMNATALFSGDALEIWCGNQVPVWVQQHCAALAGLDDDAVQVHTTFLGGGFGRRLETDYAQIATRVAMALPGTPVQVTWSREEDMRRDFFRPGAIARMRGAVRDGQGVLMDGQMAGQPPLAQYFQRMTGIPVLGPDKYHVEGLFNQPYAIPNYRMRGYLAKMDLPVASWRSVSNSANGFFHESFIDEMAHAAGRDPLEFRLDLIREEHAASAACLEAVREMSGWTGRTPEGVGRGVAFAYSFGTPVAQAVEVVEENGTIGISRMWIACDPGLALDPGIVEAQMFGAAIYGLSAAVHGEITFAGGEAEQQNFPDYDALRMHNTPAFDVKVLQSGGRLGGVGEPGTPPAAPALGNALFDLTGKRVRDLPFGRYFDLLT